MSITRYSLLLSLCMLMSSYGIHAEAPHNAEALKIYAISGSSLQGSEPEYIKDVLGVHDIDIVAVETPTIIPDLGQESCLRYLRHAIVTDTAHDAIIYATSQGTATALNYAAYEDPNKHVKGLILESALASGNCVVEHTLRGPRMNQQRIANLPLCYYWMPYVFQLTKFQAYFPAGKQPIKSASHIPNDLLVIIVHSEDDERLSYMDACALYYGLRAQGNNNVYLLSKPGTQHHCLVHNEADKAVVRAILKKHGLLEGEADQDIDLSIYQPDPTPYKERYEAILAKEKMHEIIAYSVLAAAGALIVRLIFF